MGDMDLDKFKGALMGTFVGDCLGMPIEGKSHRSIVRRFDGPLDQMKGSLKRFKKAGTYTDDTEMTIGLAEGLIEAEGVDGAVICRKFVDNFNLFRNYGVGVIKIIRALKKGVRWDEPAKKLFKGQGSYGNGAAMRIAPLGCIYFDRPERIRKAAEESGRTTHAHPLGLEGGVVQAHAVARAVSLDPKHGLDEGAFVDHLMGVTEMEEYRKALGKVRGFLEGKGLPSVETVVKELGNDITALGSVPTAIYSFLRNWRSVKDTVVYAVNLGEDTDTLGAMAGAIVGGLHGVAAIPSDWYDVLENEGKGRDYVIGLAERLWKMRQEGRF